MFIDPDNRCRVPSTAELDLGDGRTPEDDAASGTRRPLQFLLAVMTSSEPAPIDALLFGKRAGEIIAKAASLEGRKARNEL